MGEVREAEFDLPFAPSLNRYYRHVGPRVLISREGRKYRRMVVSRIGGLFPKFTGRLSISAEVYPPDNRRRDLDNCFLKSAQDALQAAGLYEDDSQIKEIHLWMREAMPPEGMVHVKVRELERKGDDDVSASRLPDRSRQGRVSASPRKG